MAALTLAALDITDELFRIREDTARQEGDVGKRLGALVELLDRLAPEAPGRASTAGSPGARDRHARDGPAPLRRSARRTSTPTRRSARIPKSCATSATARRSSRADAWRQIAMIIGHWQLRGYGLWAVEERATGALVGRIGLFKPEGWPGFELGWMLRRDAWGQGYATRARGARSPMRSPRWIATTSSA